MEITNQQAMQQLQTAKARSESAKTNGTGTSMYWDGVFAGMVSIYLGADIISVHQYRQLEGFPA